MPPAARAAAARFGRAALSSSRSVAEKQRRAILDASGDLGAALGVGLQAGWLRLAQLPALCVMLLNPAALLRKALEPAAREAVRRVRAVLGLA